MKGEYEAGSAEGRFTRRETAKILDRLIELDQLEEPGLSGSEIQDVARELGIARKLVDRAIVEGMAARRDLAGRGDLCKRFPLIEALLFAAVGVGAFLPTALLGASHLPGILGVGMISVALGLDSRRPDAWSRLRMRNLGLWTGFVAGGSTLFSMTPDMALALWIGLPVVAGTGMVVLGQWVSSWGPGSAGSSGGALRGGIGRATGKLLRKVRDGVDRLEKRFGKPVSRRLGFGGIGSATAEPDSV